MEMTITKDTPIGKAIKELTRLAKKNKDASPRDLRDIQVGEIGHQGDIYVHCAPGDHPYGPELASRQLAEGSTQGSRHMAVGKLKVYASIKNPPSATSLALLGPVVVASEPWRLEHPEHAMHLYPAGVFAIVHQMDAITGQRVQD